MLLPPRRDDAPIERAEVTVPIARKRRHHLSVITGFPFNPGYPRPPRLLRGVLRAGIEPWSLVYERARLTPRTPPLASPVPARHVRVFRSAPARRNELVPRLGHHVKHTAPRCVPRLPVHVLRRQHRERRRVAAFLTVF